MTLEYLEQQKEKYEKKVQYYSALSFDVLADSFQGVVDLIGEMEDYIKSKQRIEDGSGDECDENL